MREQIDEYPYCFGGFDDFEAFMAGLRAPSNAKFRFLATACHALK